MNSKDYEYWTKFRANTSSRITMLELKTLSKMHAHYFKHKYVIPCSCNKKKIQKYITDLNKLYDTRANA